MTAHPVVEIGKVYIDTHTPYPHHTEVRIFKILSVSDGYILYNLIYNSYNSDIKTGYMRVGSETYYNIRELTQEEKLEYL